MTFQSHNDDLQSEALVWNISEGATCESSWVLLSIIRIFTKVSALNIIESHLRSLTWLARHYYNSIRVHQQIMWPQSSSSQISAKLGRIRASQSWEIEKVCRDVCSGGGRREEEGWSAWSGWVPWALRLSPESRCRRGQILLSQRRWSPCHPSALAPARSSSFSVVYRYTCSDCLRADYLLADHFLLDWRGWWCHSWLTRVVPRPRLAGGSLSPGGGWRPQYHCSSRLHLEQSSTL